MKRISFHIETRLLQWIDRRKEPRSEFIRRAIYKEYLTIKAVQETIEREKETKH